MNTWPLLYAVLGLALLLAIAHDFIKTVLTVTGGGPLTRRIHRAIWTA